MRGQELTFEPLSILSEHCIDSLRLSLMCTADTTLIPVQWSSHRKWIMPKFETVHTCRDYSAIKEWATERDSVDAEKYHENAARLRAKSGLPPWEETKASKAPS